MPNRKTAKTTPVFTNGKLTYHEITPLGDFTHTINIESGDFQRWLERGETFSYAGEYTIRCERIKNKKASYWYAYQKDVDGKTRKKYIGGNAAVTRQKLLAVWAALRYGEDGPVYRNVIA